MVTPYVATRVQQGDAKAVTGGADPGLLVLIAQRLPSTLCARSLSLSLSPFSLLSLSLYLSLSSSTLAVQRARAPCIDESARKHEYHTVEAQTRSAAVSGPSHSHQVVFEDPTQSPLNNPRNRITLTSSMMI